jgi:hypothetical protein
MADADAFFAASLRPAPAIAAAPPPTRASKSTTAAGAQVIVMHAEPGAPAGGGFARWGGWVAAAACLVIVAAQAIAQRGAPGAPSAATAPEATTTQAPLAPGGDPAGRAATGELSWSDEAQRGTLRARGLAPSAQGEEYEAWVVDRSREGGLAVPVGHFAVSQAAATIRVELAAPVQTGPGARFVVTVEPAGGVMSSPRSRVALEGALRSSQR